MYSPVLAVILVVMVILVGSLLLRWLSPENWAWLIVRGNEAYLTSDEDGEGDAKVVPTGPSGLSPVVFRGAAAVKAKLGLLDDTRANRLIIDSEVRKWMAGLGMRPSHIVRFAPMAVEVALIPTDDELFAAKFRRSNLVRRRKGAPMLSW